MAFLVLWKHYDEKCGQRPKEDGRDPPEEATAIFGLSQSGINQRQCAPAYKELGVLHTWCSVLPVSFSARQKLQANRLPSKKRFSQCYEIRVSGFVRIPRPSMDTPQIFTNPATQKILTPTFVSV